MLPRGIPENNPESSREVISLTSDWLFRAEEICIQCGGHCCHEARPPVSMKRFELLANAGIHPGIFERNGYRYIRTREDGHCALWDGGKCTIHAIKPETCRAGPFTFDVKGDMIEIFLKLPRICPIVTLLKNVPEAYRQQYERACKNITNLVADLSDEEITVICKIEEPDTEIVAEIPRRWNPE